MGCGASADKSQACPQQGGATLLGDAAKAPAPEKAACEVGVEVAQSAGNAGDVATATLPEQSSGGGGGGGDTATASAPEKTACEGGAELTLEQSAGLTAREGVAELPPGSAGDAEIETMPQQSSGAGNAASEPASNQSADESMAVGIKEDEKQQADSTVEDEKRLTLASATPAGVPVTAEAMLEEASSVDKPVEVPATAEIQNEAVPLHEQLPEASVTTETATKQEEPSANENTAEVKAAAESGVEEAEAVFERLPDVPAATQEAVSGEQQPAEAMSEKLPEVPTATEEPLSGEQEPSEAVYEKPSAVSGEQQPAKAVAEKLPEVPAATEEAVSDEQEPAEAASEKPPAVPAASGEAVSDEQQPAEEAAAAER